ncbi:MAG: RnfABCDGE type electron transport complex subunit C [Erysipelotrichaceae bacterium]|nr:RnfABCDGE type electron transport complex subunit C [Erysipelotrichaceae bacterium]
MGLLTGRIERHLISHKDITKDKPIIEMPAPDRIYIPLVCGMATDFDILVKAGDHVDIGTMIARRKSMDVPLYATVSGTVVGTEKRMHASRRPQNHIVIENDHKDTFVPIVDTSNVDECSREELFERMKLIGLMGMGGSGFPTYMKYTKTDNIDTILINGVECEPYITSDHVTMKLHTKALFDGLKLMMRIADAQNGIIAIKEGKVELQKILEREVFNHPNIDIAIVKDVYPMGWERHLIRTVTEKLYDKLPSEVGIIVNNATTAIALSYGLREGKPVTHRLVTVSGDIANPCNVHVRVGTPVHDILEYCDIHDEGDFYLISGGPMMGLSLRNDLFVISSYMNAITIKRVPEDESAPCMRCGYCTLHCPQNLQPVRIMNAEKLMDTDLLRKLDVESCINCGFCSFICPSRIEVTGYIQMAKRRLQIEARKQQTAQKRRESQKKEVKS